MSSITPTEWAATRKQALSDGLRAMQHEHSGHYDLAFPLYLKAAQSALFLIRNTDDTTAKDKLKEQIKVWLERAERIKRVKGQDVKTVKRVRLGREEQDAVLDKGGTVNGVTYPRWPDPARPPVASTSSLANPSLSTAQTALKAQWLPPPSRIPLVPPRTARKGGRDIVQDNLEDCSVVTALIVAAEHDRKFRSDLVMSSIHAHQGQSPLSCRFWVNGAWRKIDMTDDLPTAIVDGQPHLACASSPDSLWPAIVEKAYMKLMGGYEFTGSNSAADLYTMTGWIPESISLRSATFRSEKTWTRLLSSYEKGRCVITVGTPKASSEERGEELAWGLVPQHSYAVVDMDSNARRVELLNPWRDSTNGSSKTTATSSTATSSFSVDNLRQSLGIEQSPSAAEASAGRAFWVSWDALPLHFEWIHVNWDPSRLCEEGTKGIVADGRCDQVHCEIRKPTPSSKGQSSQFRLRLGTSNSANTTPESDVGTQDEIWVLLSRHLASAKQTDGSSSKEDFIGLNVSRSMAGSGASSTSSGLYVDAKSTLIDNPHFLYRFQPDPDPSTTLYDVFVSDRGPSPALAFTLSAFTTSPQRTITIEDGPPPLPHTAIVTGRWTTGRTAGGNHTCPTFMTNPQYRLTLSPPRGDKSQAGLEVMGDVSITCEAERSDVPVNVKLVRMGGQRVADYEERDLVAGTGRYSYGQDSCRVTSLRQGSYTLIASSFSPSDEGSFEIVVSSSLPVEATLIPQEGAGMFNRTVKGSWSEGLDGGSQDKLRNPTFLLSGFQQPVNVKIRLQLLSPPAVPIALNIYSTDDDRSTPNASQRIETTEPYSDAVSGVVTRLFKLSPSSKGYLIVPSTFASGLHADFRVLLYADQPVTLVPLSR